jgi:predicted nucleic acid-binding protein
VIVVEASSVVSALIERPADPELLALLADEDLHAPTLLDFEVANALRGQALGGKLDQAGLYLAVEDFTALRITRYPMTQQLAYILDLRENFTPYDASYVVLARALEAPLVTADAKLTEAGKLGVEVRLLRQGA